MFCKEIMWKNVQCWSFSCFRMCWRGNQTGNVNRFTIFTIFLNITPVLSSLFWSPCQVHIQIPMSNIFDPFLLFSYMKSQGNDKLTPSVGRSRWYRSSLSSSCLFHSSTKFTRWVGKQALSNQVQFGTKATAQEYRKWHKIEKIVIHPDYWQVTSPRDGKTCG